MESLRIREADADAILDRRKRRDRRLDRDRRSDLDGAYNDDIGPSRLGISSAMRLYGSIVWIVLTSAIGSIFVIKEAWGYFGHLLGHR